MDPDLIDTDREAIAAFFAAYPLIYDGARRPGLVETWLQDMEMVFYLCHIEARLQVSLASRCLAEGARHWWITQGERALPRRDWAEFRVLMLAHFGPNAEIEVAGPYRNPEIYRDMYHTRYQSFSATWHAYPQESMDHYCRRFEESMIPYIPRDIDSRELHTLTILYNGVPPHIRRFVLEPMRGMSVRHMIGNILEAEVAARAMPTSDVAGSSRAPVVDTEMAEPEPVYEPGPVYEPEAEPVYEPEPADDAGMPEPVYEPGPVFPEEPIPAVPLQAIPVVDVDEEMEDDDLDVDEYIIEPEDPPVIIISSDEEEEEEEDDGEEDQEVDPEPQPAEWLEEEEDDFLDDPEEFPLGDDDEEADSDPASVITDEDIDLV